MSFNINRSQFIRGDIRGRIQRLRPPWHLPDVKFVDQCTACKECIEVCPEGILLTDKNGLPKVSFRKGECTFCGECARACPTQALNSDTSQPAWTLKAVLNDKCLPLNGVVCFSCADECETTAISLRQIVGGVSIPRFDLEACTGCGACYRVCPTSAIEIKPHGDTQ